LIWMGLSLKKKTTKIQRVLLVTLIIILMHLQRIVENFELL
jgi:formate/nitrite transporter FocA (FNT family)